MELTKKQLIEIEINLKQSDEYNELCWGGKSTIKKLLGHIKYLEEEIEILTI